MQPSLQSARQQAEAQRQANSNHSSSPRSPAAGLLVAAAVGIGLIYRGWTLVAGLMAVTDGLSPSAAQERQVAWDKATAGGVALTPLSGPDVGAAITAMGLNATADSKLWYDVANGVVQFGYIELFDDAAEDGDEVRIQASGLGINVRLTHAGTRIAVPYTSGAEIQIAGVADGGGGITSGIRTADGALFTPVIQTGQTLTVRAR